ncbi:MAG: methylated-DNA-[protein]-cysteine S-methyltransferase [Urechidicola sp.]|jgi:methylated-DNA-[protein]-cysteine S-methyltransferase
MQYRYMDSPLGQLLIAGDVKGLHFVGFPSGQLAVAPDVDWLHDEDICDEAVTQLAEYFAGERQSFSLTLCPTGTEFQVAVLQALRQIPYGATCSYGDVARAIGRPKAVRAVGAANGRNPLPIIIPCHRVIGSNGSLTGFGGGLPAKQWLLAHEGRQAGLAGF